MNFDEDPVVLGLWVWHIDQGSLAFTTYNGFFHLTTLAYFKYSRHVYFGSQPKARCAFSQLKKA